MRSFLQRLQDSPLGISKSGAKETQKNWLSTSKTTSKKELEDGTRTIPARDPLEAQEPNRIQLPTKSFDPPLPIHQSTSTLLESTRTRNRSDREGRNTREYTGPPPQSLQPLQIDVGSRRRSKAPGSSVFDGKVSTHHIRSFSEPARFVSTVVSSHAMPTTPRLPGQMKERQQPAERPPQDIVAPTDVRIARTTHDASGASRAHQTVSNVRRREEHERHLHKRPVLDSRDAPEARTHKSEGKLKTRRVDGSEPVREGYHSKPRSREVSKGAKRSEWERGPDNEVRRERKKKEEIEGHRQEINREAILSKDRKQTRNNVMDNSSEARVQLLDAGAEHLFPLERSRRDSNRDRKEPKHDSRRSLRETPQTGGPLSTDQMASGSKRIGAIRPSGSRQAKPFEETESSDSSRFQNTQRTQKRNDYNVDTNSKITQHIFHDRLFAKESPHYLNRPQNEDEYRKIGKRHSQAVKYMIPTPQYADSEDKYTVVKQKVRSSPRTESQTQGISTVTSAHDVHPMGQGLYHVTNARPGQGSLDPPLYDSTKRVLLLHSTPGNFAFTSKTNTADSYAKETRQPSTNNAILSDHRNSHNYLMHSATTQSIPLPSILFPAAGLSTSEPVKTSIHMYPLPSSQGVSNAQASKQPEGEFNPLDLDLYQASEKPTKWEANSTLSVETSSRRSRKRSQENDQLQSTPAPFLVSRSSSAARDRTRSKDDSGALTAPATNVKDSRGAISDAFVPGFELAMAPHSSSMLNVPVPRPSTSKTVAGLEDQNKGVLGIPRPPSIVGHRVESIGKGKRHKKRSKEDPHVIRPTDKPAVLDPSSSANSHSPRPSILPTHLNANPTSDPSHVPHPTAGHTLILGLGTQKHSPLQIQALQLPEQRPLQRQPFIDLPEHLHKGTQVVTGPTHSLTLPAQSLDQRAPVEYGPTATPAQTKLVDAPAGFICQLEWRPSGRNSTFCGLPSGRISLDGDSADLPPYKPTIPALATPIHDTRVQGRSGPQPHQKTEVPEAAQPNANPQQPNLRMDIRHQGLAEILSSNPTTQLISDSAKGPTSVPLENIRSPNGAPPTTQELKPTAMPRPTSNPSLRQGTCKVVPTSVTPTLSLRPSELSADKDKSSMETKAKYSPTHSMNRPSPDLSNSLNTVTYTYSGSSRWKNEGVLPSSPARNRPLHHPLDPKHPHHTESNDTTEKHGRVAPSTVAPQRIPVVRVFRDQHPVIAADINQESSAAGQVKNRAKRHNRGSPKAHSPNTKPVSIPSTPVVTSIPVANSTVHALQQNPNPRLTPPSPTKLNPLTRIASDESNVRTSSSLAMFNLLPTMSRSSLPERSRSKGFFNILRSRSKRNSVILPAVTHASESHSGLPRTHRSPTRPSRPAIGPSAGVPSSNVPNSIYTPFKFLTTRRNRALSTASLEAQDGTSTTVIGSPTVSVVSQNPFQPPQVRDPLVAANEWRLAEVRSKPGVTFKYSELPDESADAKGRPVKISRKNKLRDKS